jgi:hypothetical protein
MNETVSWFEKEWIKNDAKALGVYVALLILQFQVRYRTDIHLLCGDDSLMELRLNSYLALFLNDEEELRVWREILPNGMRVCEVSKQPTKSITTFLFYPRLKSIHRKYTKTRITIRITIAMMI